MAQATFSVRMDEGLKRQFDNLCADFGMNASVAINVFARAVVRERKIPFEIVSVEPVDNDRQRAVKAFMELRKQAKQYFPNGMSDVEINAEIASVRRGELEK